MGWVDSITTTWVVFSIRTGDQTAGVLAATLDEMGVPETAAQRCEPGRFALPGRIAAALRATVPAHSTLWLELEEPVGYLPIVPWEALLFAECRLRVIRVSPLTLTPYFPKTGKLDAILCISQRPETYDERAAHDFIVDYLTVLNGRPRGTEVRVHVFVDERLRRHVVEWCRPYRHAFEIVVHDSPSFAQPAGDDEGDGLPAAANWLVAPENPWLAWMREAIGRHSAEFVHFWCEGRLGPESAALVFPAPVAERDRSLGSWVSAHELDSFLLGIGAWLVGFSAPAASAPALRYLEHELSALRAGPILLHEITSDRAHVALHAGYRFFFDPSAFAGSRSLTLYWHPDPPTSEDRAMLEQYTLTSVIPHGKAHDAGLVLSMQRVLESGVARMAPEHTAQGVGSGDTDPGRRALRATRSAAEDAVRNG